MPGTTTFLYRGIIERLPLCVEKCLKLGEIPSCFFKLVDEDISGHADFTLGGFVRFYEAHAKKEG